MLKRFRYHWAVFFSVIGPGFITAVVDNDAGGIYTYSQAGAKYGYLPLWTLIRSILVLVLSHMRDPSTSGLARQMPHAVEFAR